MSLDALVRKWFKPTKANSWLVDFVKEKEGYRSEAYQDAVGVWTIGYGITEGVEKGDIVTKEQAEEQLRVALSRFRDYVILRRDSWGYDWSDNQVDALTSFIYNLGRGVLAQVTNGGTRSNEEIATKMKLYYNAGGVRLRGLEIRRMQESEHFSS